jgi:hypothetical protein
MYDHNKILGVTFEVSVLVLGMSPTTLEIRTTLTVFVADTIALVSMVTDVLKYIDHFALSAMLRAVVSDVTVYFFTIFLSHLLLVVTIETARVWFEVHSSDYCPLCGDTDTNDPPTLAGFANPPCNVRASSVL